MTERRQWGDSNNWVPSLVLAMFVRQVESVFGSASPSPPTSLAESKQTSASERFRRYLQFTRLDDDRDDGDDDEPMEAGEVIGLVLGALFFAFLLYILLSGPCQYWFCRRRYIASHYPSSTPEQEQARRLRQRELQRRANLLQHQLISDAAAWNARQRIDRQAESERYRTEVLERSYQDCDMRVKISQKDITLDEEGSSKLVSREDSLVPTDDRKSVDDKSANDVETGRRRKRQRTLSSLVSMQSVRIRRRERDTVVIQGTCAICLEAYRAEDTVVVSNNALCPHGFHEDCITDYLVLYHLEHMLDESGVEDDDEEEKEKRPCPCCRRKFV